MRAGISVIPFADALPRIRELVRAADDAGLDVVGIQDHPYQARFLDAFALIATLLAETRRVSLFTDVANLPLRPPAMIAKAAATLDLASGGRFELGLGAGANQDQIAGVGGPRRSPGESVDALDEAIDVIRLMWPGPRPSHPIGIWLGAFRPRMQRLAGRKADGWVPSLGPLTPDDLREGNRRIDEAAAAARRDPRVIRRVLNLQGVIGESRTAPAGRLPVGSIQVGEPLAGPPDWWAETLAGFAADGFDTLVFWPIDPTAEQVQLFAEAAHALRP